MVNWIVDCINEELQEEVKRLESLNEMAINLKGTYKNVLETDDKFEVKYHEYWRTVELMTKNEIDRINEILNQINEMEKEEVELLEEAYEDEREKRATSIGIL